MKNLEEIQRVILDDFPKEKLYPRQIFSQMTLDSRITGIVGPRGIGKTTFLLQQALQSGAREGKALYASADGFYFLENRLIDLVDQLYKETNVRLLCVDEIHKYSNWNQELKNIYDIYRDFHILFTGSSAIDLIKAKYDLSRRVILHHLHGLSFREYLEFNFNLTLPTLSLNDLIKKHVDFSNALNVPNILKHFKDYLRIGYYPFFKEFRQDIEKFQTISNVTQKIIYEDIATLHSLKTPTLSVIEKLYQYVIHSLPGELNANKIANALQKDFDNISDYLRYLEAAGLIRFLFSNKTGKAHLRNPEKMYPENTNLMHAAYLPQSQENIGKIRETFCLNQFQNIHEKVFYSDSGDMQVGDYVFEIGGKNKPRRQIAHTKNAYVLADSILVGDKKNVIIPLYLCGFLY